MNELIRGRRAEKGRVFGPGMAGSDMFVEERIMASPQREIMARDDLEVDGECRKTVVELCHAFWLRRRACW